MMDVPTAPKHENKFRNKSNQRNVANGTDVHYGHSTIGVGTAVNGVEAGTVWRRTTRRCGCSCTSILYDS